METSINGMEIAARIREYLPYKHPRSGQLGLARSVYESITESKILLARYPVGIGKTAAVLAGALAADVPKVVYLAHTKSQFQAPVREVSRLREKGIEVSLVTLVSRRDLCLFPRALVGSMSIPRFLRFCSAKRASEECPFQKPSSSAALPPILTVHSLRELGRETGVCPYELAWEAVRRARIVVASYSYLFDPILAELLEKRGGLNLSETFVVVDEAHNLVSFIMDSLSNELHSSTIRSAIREVQKYGVEQGEAIRDALRGLLSLLEREAVEDGEEVSASSFLEVAPSSQSLYRAAAEVERRSGVTPTLWTVADFVERVEKLSSGSTLLAIKDLEGDFFKIYFYGVTRVARRVFQAVRAGALLSATLQPAVYFAALLGVEREKLLETTYPFTWGKNVSLMILRGISSRFAERTPELYRRYANTIDEIFSDPESGRVLAVFPSYSFMLNVYPFIRSKPRFLERRDTSLDEVLDFLIGNEKCLVMTVAWGKFAEGVEFRALKRNLIDTIVVVGLPVPVPSVVNKKLQQTLEEVTHDREWAWRQVYLYPGLMKVIQILGRGLRSELDRIRVFLLDERAAEPEALKFFEDYGLRFTVLPT